MGKKVDFKLNLKGLNELMTGPGVQGVLKQAGQQVQGHAQAMCPEGEYNTRVKGGYWTSIAFVSVENREALKDSYEHNTLIKALYGGGK